MLKNTSKGFREFFLLKFTEQLILNSKNFEMLKLEELLKKKAQLPLDKEEVKEEIKEEVKEKLHPKKTDKKVSISEDPFSKKIEERRPMRPQFKRREIPTPPPRKVLRAPKPTQLPPQFDYLKPKPTDKSIDLGKLNVLVQDPNVKVIECEGEDTKVFVIGTMGKKPTSIVLSKEEIDAIIDKFSEESKIPKTTGIFKVVVGKLMLNAMISDAVGTRFIIKKIEDQPPMGGRIPPRRF